MTKDEVLKLALEALEFMSHVDSIFANEFDFQINAIKEALAQPEQEPVAFASHGVVNWIADRQFQHEALLYSAPQRTWESIETAPKDGTDILLMYVHIDTQVVHNGFWLGASDTDDESDIGWWSYEHSEVSRIKLDDWMTPTYWLPLPKLKEKNT